MTKNQPELKACPWCDKTPEIFTGEFTTIVCENPLCEVNPCHDNYRSRENALQHWNARPSPIIPEDAVQPVTDDDLRDAILDAQNFIDDKYEGSITRSTVQTLVTRAIKGRSK